MEEKEVKNEVPAPETVKGKEPEKQEKEKKVLKTKVSYNATTYQTY